MDFVNFNSMGKEMIDYIVNYRNSIGLRPVLPKEDPGFLKEVVPLKAPLSSEKWENVMQDVDNFIIPGITHWLHPHFHSFFPLGGSYVSILASMMSRAMGGLSNEWRDCPASIELEMIILDWLCLMFNLPEKFLLFRDGSKGGGGLQGSASECSLIILLAAQRIALKKLKKENPSVDDHELLSSLVAYCSTETHSSFEKACIIAMVSFKRLHTDKSFRLRGEELEKAIKKDIDDGYYPFFVFANFGTTASTACDKFDELGPVCAKYGLWFHIDSAYAASALICPEFRYLSTGFEYASSLNMNPSKWLLMHFDCSAMWVEDRIQFVQALAVESSLIKFYPRSPIIDYCHWGINTCRRFRSLKMWLVIRNYGVEGLRKYIRNHVRLAKYFAELVQRDDRFEVMNDVKFGLVCFRLKKSNEANSELVSSINASGKLFMNIASLDENYIIRFCVNYENASENDITNAWEIITNHLDSLEQTEKVKID